MAQFENIDFPGWEVVRKIGEGSFGGVYEIHRTLPGGLVEKCALKKLSVPKDASEIQDLYSQSFSRESITAHYQDQMSELVNEYSLTQELNGCKNVVACHDVKCVQHDDGIGWDIYIRMELLRPLKQVLGPEYRERVVLRLGMEMCNALLACQEHKIIHRDIKPENILVSEKGEFKLGDFGIAKVSEKTATGTMTGTMGYMAPEVANRWHYGAQADIYSLGMVLYWMMNQRTLPFLPYPPAIPTAVQRQEAANRRFAGEAFPPPVNGSRELKAIVMKACAFSTENRYQSVRELRRELYLCYQQHTGRAPEPAVMMPAAAPTPDEPSQRSTVGAFGSIRGDKDAQVNNTSRSGRFAALPEENSKKRVTAVTCVFAVLFLCFAIAAGYLVAHQADLTPETVLAPKTGNRMRSDYMDIIQVSDPGIERTDVASITFLDTVKDAPENSWDISEKENGSVLAWVTGQAPEYDLYIAGEGGVWAPEDCVSLFGEYLNVNSIDFGAAFDTSGVTNMTCMFWSSGMINLDLHCFDTSHATAMAGMFGNCLNLNNLDVGSFDTSHVTDMSCMFTNCERLDNLNLGNFDTSRVTNMSRMFWDCTKLNNLDVSSFDTSHVTDMQYMFGWCCELSRLNVSSFDTSLVADMSGMFYGCEKLTNLDVSSFDTSLVCDMILMFYGCDSLTDLDLSGFDFSNVESYDSFMDDYRLYNGRPWEKLFTNGSSDSSFRSQPALAAGAYHTVGLCNDGTVVAAEWNDEGQCDVNSWTDIVAVAAGYTHTVGLRSDGTVVATGANELGQCDVNSWTDIVAVAAEFWHTVGLRSDRTVVAAGWNDDGQCDVNSWTDIVAVAAGQHHTVGLRSDGTVVATGLNDGGQCDVDSWANIVAVAAGSYHTLGLRSDGTVVAAGMDYRTGPYDVDSWTDIVAVAAGDYHTVGLRSDGTVVATGDNVYGQCDVDGWTNIVAVAAGWGHTVGLRSDGTVVTAGRNDFGQCNVSDWKDIRLPQK